MMIGTQSRRPCRAVQLGEAALLKLPVSPFQFFKGEFVIAGKSKASALPTVN
jgi:hypothetical protein